MPSITGGSQYEAGYGDHLPQDQRSFTPIEPKEMRLASIADLQEQRDFECLDVRLYLALKELTARVDFGLSDGELHKGNFEGNTEAAHQIMRDFEDSHGPLPDWAIARNFGLEYVLGTQLFTRDGRRHGNAWLVSVTNEVDAKIADRENPFGEWTSYTVLTEAGSLISKMTQQELETAFWAGDWICTLDRIAERFDHDGLLRAMGAC